MALAATKLLQRYIVEGESMLPAFAPGDRVLVESWTYRFRQPRVGEAVVVVQPGSDGRKDLKRIAAGPGASVSVKGERRSLADDEWYVLGDNLDASTDSRALGPVKRQDIVGKIWAKY